MFSVLRALPIAQGCRFSVTKEGMRITDIRYEPSSPERRRAFVQFGPSTSRSLNHLISNLEELDSVNLTQPMPGQSRLSLEHLSDPHIISFCHRRQEIALTSLTRTIE